jgi:uncharacterized membrane protein
MRHDDRTARPLRRVLPVTLAFAGLVVSAYLGADQVGWIGRVWDPVFGSAASRAVLHSVVDRTLPVPDALLGAVAYAGEIVLGLAVLVASRTLVHVLYGLLALAMAVVSVGLVLLQALVVHAGCTLCLVSAVVSGLVAALVVPEAVRAWRGRAGEVRAEARMPETLSRAA